MTVGACKLMRALAASMFSRTISKPLKGIVFIATASTVLYLCARSPAWLSGPVAVDHAAPFQPPVRELLSKTASNSIVDHDLQIGDKRASNLHKSSAAARNLRSANPEPEPEVGTDHAPSMFTRSAHAQKQTEQCVPVGGHSSTVRVLGRQLEKCRPEWRSEKILTSNFSPDDIYITVKTTQKNHKTRMLPILLTWLQTVQPEQVIA